ncbi:PMEI domain-containing protein [Cephalotus follicularis]|uniref:PMEI domain-containing protein n=1 Tax=Cephalotus follicularis TaxID=3775 RepID=A0A1Q3BUN3_CEPFO|nr:PMEI domain-containing protein [Cephalotus follicularis]
MAIASFIGNISLMVSLVLIITHIIKPSLAVTSDELNRICSHTLGPSFCVQSLKSDPRTANADYRGLCRISLDVAERNARGTLTLINDLIAKEANPILTDRYTQCVVNYNSAISLLEDARQKFDANDFVHVAGDGSTAQVEARSCERRFANPPKDASSLSQSNNNVATLGSLVFYLAVYISSPV